MSTSTLMTETTNFSQRITRAKTYGSFQIPQSQHAVASTEQREASRPKRWQLKIISEINEDEAPATWKREKKTERKNEERKQIPIQDETVPDYATIDLVTSSAWGSQPQQFKLFEEQELGFQEFLSKYPIEASSQDDDCQTELSTVEYIQDRSLRWLCLAVRRIKSKS